MSAATQSLLAERTAGRRAARLSFARVSLAALAGAMLAIPYLFPECYLLGWIACLPLLVAIERASLRHSYVLGLVAGVTLYVTATYWLVAFVHNLKGYSLAGSAAFAMVFWAYSAQAMALIAVLVVWLRKRTQLSPILLLPTTAVAINALFPSFAPTHPGETQALFLYALQATDLTGVFGLDFVMVLAGATLYAWLRNGSHERQWIIAGLAVLASWMIYGVWMTSLWNERTANWDTLEVGVVQPNQSPNVSVPLPDSGFGRAYPREMEISESLAGHGAELIVWPETRFKGFFDYAHVRASFERQVAALRTSLIFHDLEPAQSAGSQHNSAVFIDEDGKLAGTYRKVERMPFGEYLPFVSDVPAARAWFEQYLGDFLTPIIAGNDAATFRVRDVSIVPLICYESMLSTFVAESIGENARGRMLVTLTNDGWFGATRQPYMHAYASLVRAVENRVPLIHVINNGPSLVASPSGEVLFMGAPQTAAGYVVPVPYSSAHGGSFYTRQPYLFIGLVWVGLAALVLIAAIHPRPER